MSLKAQSIKNKGGSKKLYQPTGFIELFGEQIF
jgi:hypothetical protein